MSNTTENTVLLWLNHNGVLVNKLNTGILMASTQNICDYTRVIGSQITNRLGHDGGIPVWNLRPYRYLGRPNHYWLLRDVGSRHWENDTNYCSGTTYGRGKIDRFGVLVGLPYQFVTNYAYNGYMQIQEGYYDCSSGYVIMPCGRYRKNYFG